MQPVSALILAAGTASRMGQTKQLLDLGGAPILEQVIQSVKKLPFADILIVIGHDRVRVQNKIILNDDRCRWVMNPDYAHGQSYSLKIGLQSVQTKHVMVFLGDQPLITNRTISAIYHKGQSQAREQPHPFVIRPVHSNFPGHPVFFGHVKHIDFSKLSADRGANALIKQMEDYIELPVADEGCIFDIDTPDAYEQAIERWKKLNSP